MTDKCIFNCQNCNGEVVINSGEPAEIPECCGMKMVQVEEPLDHCTSASVAEHSRGDKLDDPCDDGRAGSL